MLKSSKNAAKIQAKIGELLASVPISANAWTVLSLLAGLCGFGSLYYQNLLLGMAFFTLSFALDAIDGAVARAKKQVSAKGAFLDGMLDRLNEFFLLTGLMFYPFPAFIMPASFWLLMILFFGTCMTSFVKAYAEHAGALSHEQAMRLPGVLERPERALALLASMLVALYSPELASIAFAFVSALCFLTFAERFFAVLIRSE